MVYMVFYINIFIVHTHNHIKKRIGATYSYRKLITINLKQTVIKPIITADVVHLQRICALHNKCTYIHIHIYKVLYMMHC